MEIEPADERPHPPGDDPSWAEWWHFDVMTGPGGLLGHVRLCLLPHRGVARYWASLTGPGRSPVVVHDDEVPVPRAGSLEIRTEGLWADHIVERPFEQVTVACEAFGLRLDSSEDLRSEPLVGERIPFGLDLEWESSPRTEVGPALDGCYAVVCEVHGLVLVGDEQLALEGGGSRSHGWGTDPPAFALTPLDL